ncbi:MAG: flagellar biosynthesis protein FlgH [Alteromonadaceae bacterium]|nr:MAG: flagellar biosynthesis protein FlgH [Alteromonadaceae bacterium]
MSIFNRQLSYKLGTKNLGTKILLLVILLSPTVWANSVIDIDNYQALTSDRRAFRVGDPLVILVVESTTAQSSASTGVSKRINIEARAFDNISRPSVGLDLGAADEGTGQTIRSGKARTQLSARITKILPNETYLIEGRQNLIVNDEDQSITLSGIVRAYDISKDNTLMSNRISEAKISIHGDGSISKAQKQSLVYRLMQWLGLF